MALAAGVLEIARVDRHQHQDSAPRIAVLIALNLEREVGERLYRGGRFRGDFLLNGGRARGHERRRHRRQRGGEQFRTSGAQLHDAPQLGPLNSARLVRVREK